MRKNGICICFFLVIRFTVICALLIMILAVHLSAQEHKVHEDKQIEGENKGIILKEEPSEHKVPEERQIEDEDKRTNLQEETSDKKSSGEQIIDEIEISIKPKVDDTIKTGCIHPPLNVKYGITPNWEFTFRLNTFFNNPLRGEVRNGVSDVTIGTRYHWKNLLKYHIDTITAFSIQMPAGSSEDISAEYTHYRPELKFIKTVPRWNMVQLATTIKLDILSGSSEGIEISSQDLLDNSLTFTISALFPVSSFNYVFETEWITTEIDGGNQNIVYLTSGIFYDMPEKKYPLIRGAMQLGFGVRIGVNDTEDDFAFFARVNWDLPLKLNLKKRPKNEKNITN